MYFAVIDMLQASGSREPSVLSMLTLATVIVALLFAFIVGFIHKRQKNVAYVVDGNILHYYKKAISENH